MKQLVCEMCGSKELVKQDGVFVCQSCSTKYSVEEAKKMMVTIDNSGKVENALKSARRAMENKSYEQAEKFYNIVLEEEPENWEATFYSVYSSVSKPGLGRLNAEDSIKSCLGTVLKDIKKIEDTTQQNEAIKQIHTDLRYFEEILCVFANELISKFGENEFTNSIRAQCFEILLKRENNLYTMNKNDWTKAQAHAKRFNSAIFYANVLTKIKPTSYELARYNKLKEQDKKSNITCGVIALAIIIGLIVSVISGV